MRPPPPSSPPVTRPGPRIRRQVSAHTTYWWMSRQGSYRPGAIFLESIKGARMLHEPLSCSKAYLSPKDASKRLDCSKLAQDAVGPVGCRDIAGKVVREHHLDEPRAEAFLFRRRLHDIRHATLGP